MTLSFSTFTRFYPDLLAQQYHPNPPQCLYYLDSPSGDGGSVKLLRLLRLARLGKLVKKVTYYVGTTAPAAAAAAAAAILTIPTIAAPRSRNSK